MESAAGSTEVRLADLLSAQETSAVTAGDDEARLSDLLSARANLVAGAGAYEERLSALNSANDSLEAAAAASLTKLSALEATKASLEVSAEAYEENMSKLEQRVAASTSECALLRAELTELHSVESSKPKGESDGRGAEIEELKEELATAKAGLEKEQRKVAQLARRRQASEEPAVQEGELAKAYAEANELRAAAGKLEDEHKKLITALAESNQAMAAMGEECGTLHADKEGCLTQIAEMDEKLAGLVQEMEEVLDRTTRTINELQQGLDDEKGRCAALERKCEERMLEDVDRGVDVVATGETAVQSQQRIVELAAAGEVLKVISPNTSLAHWYNRMMT
jgi:chromosome segregation ATPase